MSSHKITKANLHDYCGWWFNPAAIEKFVTSLLMPTFKESGKALKGSGEGKSVWFWGWEDKLIGFILASFNQKIGDCVGQGWARAIQDLMGLEIASGELEMIPKEVLNRIRSQTGEHGIVATEPIYGGSRCEVGGQWGSRSDGSVGSWAAKWVSEVGGTLLRMKYGSIDLSTYDPNRAKEYGARGCPDELEPKAREHLVKTVTQVSSYEQVRDMLVNGYPVPVASNQGFKMKRRAQGICDPEGVWMHQMLFRGHLILKGNRPVVCTQNSWGDYLGNSNNTCTLETGETITLPEGCFNVVPEVVDKMARQGDTFAISHFNGFPANPDPTPWIFE